jgi:hypothetical protein
MRQRADVSLQSSATHNSYLLHYCGLSGTDHTDPTSDLYDLPRRGTVACGNRIYHHVSRIWYGTSPVLHPGDTRPDHPTDFLAFSVIVYLVLRSNLNKVPIPRLFQIIAQDATYYFLVIFTSHFVIVMFLAFANVRISSRSSMFTLRLA